MEIKGIIIIAIGLLSSIAIYTDLAGFLSSFAQKICHLLIGVGSYILPLYLLYLGYSYFKGRGNISLGKKFHGITIFIGVIILVFATTYIQAKEVPNDFGNNFIDLINAVADGKRDFNGGVIGYVIAFPLYKFIGGLGSYILYGTLIIISCILVFDFSPLKAGQMAKSKGREFREKERAKKKVPEYKDKADYIKVLSKDDEVDKSKDEFLKGVNHKIKILDFMKNSNVDEESEFELNIEENLDRPISDFVDTMEFPEKTTKKEKLDNTIKEVVNKEIDATLSESKDIQEIKEYIFPKIGLLNINGKTKLNSEDKKELIGSASKLEEILGSFGVDAKVAQVTKGPSVTRYEIQPSPGVKVSKIVNLADDIALGLASSGVRIEAPIPGKAAVGIEVPNKKQTPVFLREVLDSDEFQNSTNKLAFALGKDITGACVVGDLSKMPHTLIAGATGSGKSVCINSLIISILYKYSPEEVKLLMVDPKVVELNVYNGIPHLLIPVVTDPKKAAAALNWAVNEMTKRYNLFAEKGVRNIDSYNGLFNKGVIDKKLPYIVIIVDELADLMMVCPNDVEDYIGRLAQMARAAGMHLVIATQRPSVDVITGVIKANIPSRISFSVSSQIDSRTILDSSGAEKLLGKGDMLYSPVGENKPLRVQGCFISEEEVESVVNFIKNDEKEIIYEESIMEHINNETDDKYIEEGEDTDELLSEAVNLVVDFEQASISFIQRRLRVGFNRASRIMDQLEERGIISPKDGSRPRQVLVTKDELIG
ncbi:MAG TPA: DNA translocase FtsK 4TM domain-containing protein, partial [Clostridium sp.]